MQSVMNNYQKRKFTLIIALLGIMLSATTSLAETVTLKEVAYVSGPKIYVGDLAEIEGDNAAFLASIEVTTAAHPGATKQVYASLIASRLRNAGAKAEKLDMKGAQRVKTTTLFDVVTRHDLVNSLKQHIEGKMPWSVDQAIIDIPLPKDDVMVSEGNIDIKWRTKPSFNYLGQETFKGTISVEGNEQRTIYLRSHIDAKQEIVFTARDILRGAPVSPADLELRTRPMSTVPSSAILSIEDAVGMIARKTIFPNQPLTTRHVEPRTVVKRNQLVPVEMKVGALRVQTRAQALSNARAGDFILLQNPGNKQQFQGVVRADGVVIVP